MVDHIVEEESAVGHIGRVDGVRTRQGRVGKVYTLLFFFKGSNRILIFPAVREILYVKNDNVAKRSSEAMLPSLKCIYYKLYIVSSKTSYVARSPPMRKSHLCRSWSAAAAASYGETNFFKLVMYDA
ncbi:hypothetical protein OUZ56_012408 [Daphnia magna]|uniref:Uncharacterized protein n=1 Tax=Daphnia magna TaxID=35525 RepID=A0ABQ9Z317_9CRUS|nr:hypothetical protein OUZ56_012408 [Daphnia magna]